MFQSLVLKNTKIDVSIRYVACLIETLLISLTRKHYSDQVHSLSTTFRNMILQLKPS